MFTVKTIPVMFTVKTNNHPSSQHVVPIVTATCSGSISSRHRAAQKKKSIRIMQCMIRVHKLENEFICKISIKYVIKNSLYIHLKACTFKTQETGEWPKDFTNVILIALEAKSHNIRQPSQSQPHRTYSRVGREST